MKNISKIFIVLVLTLFVSGFTFAEEATIKTNSSKVTVVANLNIQEAQVIAQIDNVFNILFFLQNGEGIQAGVKYGVQLIKETDKGQFIMDEYIYPELLAVPSNSRVKKDIIYKAPENISGEYSLFLNAKNKSGLGLGIAYVGKVILSSKTQKAEILPETCYLSVEGEDPQIKYNLSQGVDIDSEENLVINCNIVNSSDKEISVTPIYETHYRNIYGEVVPQKGGDSILVNLKAGENKEVSLILPKAIDPQAYDVILSFDSQGVFSNQVVAHYVLRGLSATIQNFSLDKDFYKKDETAHFNLSWAASADSFPGARKTGTTDMASITLELSIKDGLLKNCIKPINKVINENLRDGTVEIQAPVIADCDEMTAALSLRDIDGSLLAAQTLSFDTKIEKDEEDLSSTYAYIILGAIVVIGLVIYFINNKKEKENEKTI